VLEEWDTTGCMPNKQCQSDKGIFIQHRELKKLANTTVGLKIARFKLASIIRSTNYIVIYDWRHVIDAAKGKSTWVSK